MVNPNPTKTNDMAFDIKKAKAAIEEYDNYTPIEWGLNEPVELLPPCTWVNRWSALTGKELELNTEK